MSKRIILALIFLFIFAKDAYSKILPTFVQKVDTYLGGASATNGIALNPDGQKYLLDNLIMTIHIFLNTS